MMKPILRKLIFYSLCLACCGVARSQVYPIRVNVQLIPPYSAFIDDYKTKPVISFTNQSQSPMDVYLRGSLQNDRGQYIQTKPNVFTNVPIHVPGLQTIVVQGNQID